MLLSFSPSLLLPLKCWHVSLLKVVLYIYLFSVLLPVPTASSMQGRCGFRSPIPESPSVGPMPGGSWLSYWSVLDKWVTRWIPTTFCPSLLFRVTPRCFLAGAPAYLEEEIGGGDLVACHLVFRVKFCLNLRIQRQLKGNSHNLIMEPNMWPWTNSFNLF